MMRVSWMREAITSVCGLLLVACGADGGASSGVSPSAGAPAQPATAGGGAGGGSAGQSGGGGGIVLMPQPVDPEPGGAEPIELTGVIPTELGGYKRGDAVTATSGDGGVNVGGDDGCGVLVGIVRDFNTKTPGRHPDFEIFSGQQVVKGLVGPEIDADRKPVYASVCEATPSAALCPTGQQTTSKLNFDQWYRNTPDVNHAFLLYFKMQPVGNVVSFQSDNFVPVDGVGFNDTEVGLDGVAHNYGFTTELHVKFKYSGGETFTFMGDDDVWAFINGKLAIDLGGLHEARTDTVVLDDRAAELGLVKGNVYPLDLFQAERHSTGSHFRIDSTLTLVDCGTIPEVR